MLYRILECPDLMSDACLCEEGGALVLLSTWGRDTAIQELLARLTLSESEEKRLTALQLADPSDFITTVRIGSVERLEKRTTRAYRRTLFGSLIHLWLLDRRCLAPDRANASALAVLPAGAQDSTQRLWSLAKETCPLPMLDHWRDPVLELLHARNMLSPLPIALGRVAGYRLAINVPALAVELGERIRNETLSISASDT